MVDFSYILNKLGYKNHDEQIALVQLAAFTGCIYHKEESYVGSFILASKAAELLRQINFKSLDEGLTWWLQVTQASWFRRNQYQRSLEYEKMQSNKIHCLETKENTSVRSTADINRWKKTSTDEINYFLSALQYDKTQKDKKHLDIHIDNNKLSLLKKNPSAAEEKLINICDKLHLIQPIFCEDFSKINFIVFHGSKDHIIRRNIKFIDKNRFSGSIYYLTNASFLFLGEKSLPFILANWFISSAKAKKKKRKIIQCLKNIFQQEIKKTKSLQRDWNKDLPLLKETILEQLRKKNLITKNHIWPTGYSSYYKNPGVYERNMKHEGLNYSAADWPTRTDMFEYWLRRHFKEKMDNIMSCPIYPDNNQNKQIATTEETVRYWYRSHGKHLMSNKNTRIVFLSTNRNIHYMLYQHESTRKALQSEIADFYIQTIGPGVRKSKDKFISTDFRFSNALDALSKTMYDSVGNIRAYLGFFKNKNYITSQEKINTVTNLEKKTAFKNGI